LAGADAAAGSTAAAGESRCLQIGRIKINTHDTAVA
jgi:hypothetical protein